MPSAAVAGRSLLLAESGWIECDHSSAGLSIAGIDRHGKVSMASVAIKARKGKECPIFFGTSLCCGAFSPTSTILDAAGHVHKMTEVAATGLVGDLKFETQLDSDCSAYDTKETSRLWNALSNEAAYADESKAIIRCRRTILEKADIPCWFGFVERCDGRLYYRIDKIALDRAGGGTPPILDELAQIFLNDDGLSEFDRECFYLPMAIAASWAARGQSYAMSYDTLQHTAAVFLKDSGSGKTSLASGRCVTVIGQARGEWEMIWRESLWNPICNGLILVGH